MSESDLAQCELDGISARAVLTADHLSIQRAESFGATVIALKDIPRVVLEWPRGTGTTSRSGYVQFVTRDDSVVGGAFALQTGKANVIEIASDQLQAAIAFVARIESLLPNPDAAYTIERPSPTSSTPTTVARSGDATPTPLQKTGAPTTAKPTPSAARPIQNVSPTVRATSRPSNITAMASPELEQSLRISNAHLGTIAAGVILLATVGMFGFWFFAWLTVLMAVFKENVDLYGATYQVTTASAGHVIFALIFAAVSTFGSWKVARNFVGAD